MIQRIAVRPVELGLASQIQPASPRGDAIRFSDVLDRLLRDAEGLQTRTSDPRKGSLEGVVQDISQVMRAAEEAGIAFELLTELRNRLLETYRELMRMQV